MGLETLKTAFLDLTSDAIAVGQVGSDAEAPRFVYVNDAFATLFACSREDVLGQTADLFHSRSSNSPFIRLKRGQAYTSGMRFQENAELLRFDGTRFLASVSAFLFEDEGDEERYICATYRDISPKMDAERFPGRQLEVLTRELEDLRRRNQELDSAYHRLKAALNSYPDPIAIYSAEQRLVYCNEGFAATITGTPDDLVPGLHAEDILRMAVRHKRYPAAIGREDDWINEILSKKVRSEETTDVELEGDIHHRLLRYRSPNGDYIVIRLNSTELVRQKRAAEQAKERLLAALNAYPAPFVIYDADDCLVVCNDAYKESMSENPDDLKVGLHRTEVARIAIRAGKIVDAIGREELWMSAEHQEDEMLKPVQDLELPGDVHHRLLRSRVENGDLVILRIDTTELVRQRRMVEQNSRKLEKANAEITHMALHDELTGLGNRRFLAMRFEEIVQERTKRGGEIAALHIDLDRFKQINETMGHIAGDDVLLETSKRICRCLDSEDIVARIGGDEFFVLLHIVDDARRAENLASSLLTELSRPMLTHGKECRIGASIGLAQTPLVATENLLTNSDVALYKAKRQGRGRLEVFNQSDLDEVRRTKMLADDVLRGVDQAEFEPYYQPIVAAKSGKLVGIEVLARWRHPVRGILVPGEFLNVATDMSAAGKIDQQVFEHAIQECRHLPEICLESPSLSFNVSENRVNFADIENLRQQVQAYPGQVSFELLETIFLEEQDDAFLQRLDQLRELGIAIEVDDFGSGRASVVALQRINPDRLKIDHRLAALVTSGSSGLRLLRSIIEIAQALEMGVTAEGVETREQAEMLAKLGCDRLQGYFFARPMPYSELIRFMKSQPVSPSFPVSL